MCLIIDELFRYRGFCGNDAECLLRVYERPGSSTVAVASELESNRGTSIVNMVTYLAGWIWHMLERPKNGMIWVEHVPQSGVNGVGTDPFDAGTFCRVDFVTRSAPSITAFTNPVWIPLSREAFFALIQ